ncbi:restriction endonuclease subunit S [Synechococcus sp. TAK9802]|uniref:restriction endonuclease subunit S n=1 Tax=Synechococcus sp. TAK9802 TaxID=1442558 RepID=UPI001646B2EF|nr:restriction endonuclease subunit S [Synechococcus sp. TAK9802]QNI62106.1 Putative Type I restriction-modification system S subunit [Synechococcus sp. TAK9802]
MTFENTVTFEELFEIPLRNGLTKPKAVRGSGIRMVNMGELFANGRLINTPMERVPTTSAEFEKSKLMPGDLLFARQSLVLSGAGKCSIFLKDEEDVVFESHLIRCRLNKQKADPYFYYSYFSSWQGRSVIESITEQVAVAGIRGSDLAKVEVACPPIKDQKAIAHILGTLDDKIELNRKTNETLEGIAKALFKSWFVDFDPVRAKAEGRPTGLPDDISELFPDSFDESELGEIPRGWKFETLGALTSWSSGSTPSKKNPDYWGGSVPWISANSMKDIFAMNSELKLTVEGVKSGAKLARSGSILLLVRGSGLHSRISMCLAASEVSFNQDVKAIEASNEFGISAFQIFAYLSAISDQLLGMVEFTGIGAGKLDTDTLLALPFAIPGECLRGIIEEVLSPIYEKIKANLWMENSLEHLRDALLPRLISGEIRVPDAEKMLEEIGI